MQEIDGFGPSGESPEFLRGANPEGDGGVTLCEGLDVDCAFVENLLEREQHLVSVPRPELQHARVLVRAVHPVTKARRAVERKQESRISQDALSPLRTRPATQNGRKNAHGKRKPDRRGPARFVASFVVLFPINEDYRAEGTDSSQGTPQLLSNISACLAISGTIASTLGPRGMDKLIVGANGEATISNDGATILKLLEVVHPAAKTLVDIARAQDAEVGDGTTSVVLLAGEFLRESKVFIEDGVSPHIIIKGYRRAAQLVRNASIRMNHLLTIYDFAGDSKSKGYRSHDRAYKRSVSLLAPHYANARLIRTK